MKAFKSFAEECVELGEFRNAYMKRHNLKRLGMAEACQLWREHQSDVAAKDERIAALEKALRKVVECEEKYHTVDEYDFQMTNLTGDIKELLGL